MFRNNKILIEPLSSYELVATITKKQCLWDEFRAELQRNNVITGVATKEHLFIFLRKNRKVIEEKHRVLKQNEKEELIKSRNSMPEHLIAAKKTLTPSQSVPNNLFHMIKDGFKIEIGSNTSVEKKNAKLKRCMSQHLIYKENKP